MWLCMNKSVMCVCICETAQICESHHFLCNTHAATPELKVRPEEVMSPPNLFSVIAGFPVFVVSVIPIT